MRERLISFSLVLFVSFAVHNVAAWGAAPNPVLNSIFPPGGCVGETVEVTIAGSALDVVKTLRCHAPGITFAHVEGGKNRFRVTIAPETPLGVYDVRAVCSSGLSSSRPFVIGNRSEQLELPANEEPLSAPSVPLDTVINGRIEKQGDVDYYRFEALRGQRVVLDCAAERIDSQLRAVLEVFDSQQHHLQSSRGYLGVDPLIDFRVPDDGTYIVKVYDLTYTGSLDHYYRLDIDTGPRVAFASPAVVQRGRPAHVTLYGWNLSGSSQDLPKGQSKTHAKAQNSRTADHAFTTKQRLESDRNSVASLGTPPEENTDPARATSPFEKVDVVIPAEMIRDTWPLPLRRRPAQMVIRGFAYHLPGSHAPVSISVTDVPVSTDESANHSPDAAMQLDYPGEVSGQLATGDEQDWFAINALRGEVLYIEGFAQRINSPTDLDVRVLDARAEDELIRFGDEVRNVGGKSFPTSQLDPRGRWRVPSDGRYLILVRDVIGGSQPDPRRTYRLSIRREEPDFSLAVVPHRSDPAGVNVQRGGRTLLDLIALRRRGLTDPIRVSAKDLPAGITCPDVWIGSGVDRAPLVISAEPGAPEFVGELTLEGATESAGARRVHGGVVVRAGAPNGWSRLTSDIPLAIAGESPVRISADGHEPRDHQLFGKLNVRHSPGGILDVAVYVQRVDTGHQAAIKLSGVGLPDLIENQTAVIPSGSVKGYISFYLPPSLPIGHYSLAVQGETTVPKSDGKAETVTVFSDVVSFEVFPPAFRIEVDRFAPRRIKRGEVLQIGYSARRSGGFINKIHTELAEPGQVTDVVGLRGRGVTFVGQTENGAIQIIANDDAPLGQLPFLRLYGVGVLEDKPLFHGSCWLNLEVVQ